MIPPNTSLVRFDNPVLVTKNTEKKTPKVNFVGYLNFRVIADIGFLSKEF